MNRTTVLLLVLTAMSAGGCVRRTISITSEPAGALVYLNDEEVGRTPVSVEHRFYGVYDVRLELEGYQPLWTKQEAVAPWWEMPGPDLVAEAIPGTKVENNWNFVLEPLGEVQPDAIVERGRQMEAMMQRAPASEAQEE